MIRTSVILAAASAVVLGSVSTVSRACETFFVDSGYVRDAENCDVAENVIAYNTTRHNHWESGGTFTISDTARTKNGWEVGTKAGYEASAEVKAGVLAEVTAAAKVSVGVEGKMSGDEWHEWQVTDSVEKQHCKCPLYKEWVDKPTEAGDQKVEQWIDPCDGGENFIWGTDWAVGTATGDHNSDGGVTGYYDYTQEEDECKDCYGTGGDCPGTP